MANTDSTQSIEHSEDVASSFDSCSNAFGHISAILNTIQKQAADHSDIKKLAGAALYISRDYENLADCWREDAVTAIKSH